MERKRESLVTMWNIIFHYLLRVVVKVNQPDKIDTKYATMNSKQATEQNRISLQSILNVIGFPSELSSFHSPPFQDRRGEHVKASLGEEVSS